MNPNPHRQKNQRSLEEQNITVITIFINLADYKNLKYNTFLKLFFMLQLHNIGLWFVLLRGYIAVNISLVFTSRKRVSRRNMCKLLIS